MQDDVKIVQDTKIIQQIIGKFPPAGNQINIIMVNQVNGKTQESLQTIDPLTDFDLMKFLETLPEPRVENLLARAIQVVSNKFDTKVEASKFLGLSSTSFYRYREVRKMLDDEVRDVKVLKLIEPEPLSSPEL